MARLPISNQTFNSLARDENTGRAGSCASTNDWASLAPASGAIRVVFSGVVTKPAPRATASLTSAAVERIFSATSSPEQSCTHAALNRAAGDVAIIGLA